MEAGDIYALVETQVCLLEVLSMNRKRLPINAIRKKKPEHTTSHQRAAQRVRLRVQLRHWGPQEAGPHGPISLICHEGKTMTGPFPLICRRVTVPGAHCGRGEGCWAPRVEVSLGHALQDPSKLLGALASSSVKPGALPPQAPGGERQRCQLPGTWGAAPTTAMPVLLRWGHAGHHPFTDTHQVTQRLKCHLKGRESRPLHRVLSPGPLL